MKYLTHAILLAVTCAGAAWSQSMAGFGAVAGFALETPGSGLPDTTVILTNTSIGLRRQVDTTDDGAFDIPALPAAAGYRLKLSRQGYSDWESSLFDVAVGQSVVLQIVMRKGKPASDVNIETVASRVESNQTGLTTLVDRARTGSLPSSQRLLDPLVLLAPTVTSESSTGRIAFHSETSANAFLQDGILTTSAHFGERPGIAGALTQDNTQELRVLAATYPAEYGHAMGGAVDAIASTGNNEFHGAAFAYIRNSGFDAANRFAPGQSLLGRRNQLGASVGGPLQHDRLFFFANFENFTDHFEAINQIVTRTIANAAGTGIAASNCTATAAQCAAVTNFIRAQMNVVVPFSEHSTGGLARLDYRRSEANSLNLAFNLRDTSSPEEARRQLVATNGGLIGLRNSTENTRFFRLGWSVASSRLLVNELRLGAINNRYFEPASEGNLSTGNVAITVAGATVGAVHPTATSVKEHRYQAVDNVTATLGTHTIRLGGDFSRTREFLNSLNSAGSYTYTTLTAFAQDFSGTARNYNSFTEQYGTAVRRVPFKEVALYAQDTWRAFPRFDITVGVRWEKTSLPSAPATNPVYYQTGHMPGSNNAVSPRISLAYLLNDNTVVRVGYGYFYAPIQGQAIDALLNGNGLSQTSVTVNTNQAQAPYFPKLTAFNPNGISNLMYASSKLRNPHTEQATVAIERRLRRSTTITLTGIESHAVKLWTGTDVNLIAPTRAVTYPYYTPAGKLGGYYTTSMWATTNSTSTSTATAKLDSKHAHVYSVTNDGYSRYIGGSAEVRRTLGKQLTLQGSYTWSHARGTNTGPLTNGVFSLSTTPVNVTTDEGNLSTDQRHRGVVNFTWQPKFSHGDSWVARVVNGWQATGIATVASGLGITPTVLVAGNQNSSLTMAYFSSLNGTGGWARAAFVRPNSLTADRQQNLDARLERSIQFTERLKGAFAVEVFNVLNSQRITGVNSIAYTATASSSASVYSGIIRSIAGAGVGNASTSFPDGTSARRAQLAFRFVF